MLAFMKTQKKNSMNFLILIFLLLAPHFEPSWFNVEGSKVDQLYNMLRVLSTAVAFFFYIGKKGRISNGMLVLLITEGWLLTVTFIYEGVQKSPIINAASLIIVASIIDCFAEEFPKQVVQAHLLLYEILIYANFATILWAPEGLYKSEWQTENWLLGFRNGFIVYFIPALCFALIWKEYTGKTTRFRIMLVVCWLSMLLGNSATGLFAMLLFTLLYMLGIYRKQFFTSSLVAKAWIVVFLGVVIFRIQNLFTPVFEFFRKNTTFTGRTYIWNETIKEILKKPILGHGHQNVEQRVALVKEAYAATNAHDFILEFLYSGGIVGLILIGAFLGITIYRLYQNKNCRTAHIFCLGLACFFLVMVVETLTTTPQLYSFLLLGSYVKKIDLNISERIVPDKKICFCRKENINIKYANKKISF